MWSDEMVFFYSSGHLNNWNSISKSKESTVTASFNKLKKLWLKQFSFFSKFPRLFHWEKICYDRHNRSSRNIHNDLFIWAVSWNRSGLEKYPVLEKDLEISALKVKKVYILKFWSKTKIEMAADFLRPTIRVFLVFLFASTNRGPLKGKAVNTKLPNYFLWHAIWKWLGMLSSSETA